MLSYHHTLTPLNYPSQHIIYIYYLFCREHMNHLKIENPRRAKNEQWLQVEHNRSFGAWIRDKVNENFKSSMLFYYYCLPVPTYNSFF